MLTVAMNTAGQTPLSYDLNITEEELKAWRAEFKKTKKEMMIKSTLPEGAYPWNGTAMIGPHRDRPDIKNLDIMFLCYAIRSKKYPVKKL